MDQDCFFECTDRNQFIDMTVWPIKDVLSILLQDKTTKNNIIWATDTYRNKKSNCSEKDHMTVDSLTKSHPIRLYPRILKNSIDRQNRTRNKGEVFTPLRICNYMNNQLDAEWFEREVVFNYVCPDNTIVPTEGNIVFPEGKSWIDYVDLRCLEITCGEAPFLVSRYDVSTGEEITKFPCRIGILDRKLRIVNENAISKDEWDKWVLRAFQSCYGYEWQGDNLLIARINLLQSYCDYYIDKWGEKPSDEQLKQIANTIAWNLWQMDGLNDTVPLGKPYQESIQTTLFDSFETKKEINSQNIAYPCKIFDWRCNNSIKFNMCKKRGKLSKKMFDFVIGNPPYQETQDLTSDTPVYNIFMDSAYQIGDCVELITPGRFLFDAGKTPKAWNQKMLDDPHLSVLEYIQDSSLIFSGVDIKGGVAITYRDSKKNIGPIGLFSPFTELNTLLRKIKPFLSDASLDDIIYSQNKWNLDELYLDYPQYKAVIGSGGRERRLTTSIFSLDIFHSEKQDDDIEILGLINNRRVKRYVCSKYVDYEGSNLEKFKVILPKSNGSGAIGEVISTPLVGTPLVGYTQSFISFGAFETEDEANACLKYIKTKFARSLLGTLKVTQDNNKGVWVNVPMQDFTNKSDIDWSKTVFDIDRQLYSKYKLSVEEIEFIESHVQEME